MNNSKTPLAVLKGHTAGINCLELLGDYSLISAGNDRTIKV